MRFTTAMLASLTVIVATGCGVDEGSTDTDIGTLDQGLSCQPDEGIAEMQAALAVAIAREMKRWDGLADFAKSNITVDTRQQVCNPWACWTEGSVYTMSGIVLSSTGEARCAANGGCPTVKAILALQTTEYRTKINGQDVVYWNGPVFASRMVAGWDRLWTDTNAWRCRSVSHTLAQPTVAVADGCGQLDYSFDVVGSNPGAVACQMVLFASGADYNTNPWVNFRVAESRAVIDPTDSTVWDPVVTTPICWDTPSGFAYDPTKNKVGQCCIVGGYYKVLHSYNSSWDKCY